MLDCIRNSTWFRTCFFTVLAFHTKTPQGYPQPKSMLKKGEKDDSSCEKFSQRQNQAKPSTVLLPTASCAPHCYLARPHCFVITLSDPVWGEQLSSTGRKGNRPSSETPGKYFFAVRVAQADSKEQRWLKAAQWTSIAGRCRVRGYPPSQPKSALQSRVANAPLSSGKLLCLTRAALANPPLRWRGQGGREPPCSKPPQPPTPVGGCRGGGPPEGQWWDPAAELTAFRAGLVPVRIGTAPFAEEKGRYAGWAPKFKGTLSFNHDPDLTPTSHPSTTKPVVFN